MKIFRNALFALAALLPSIANALPPDASLNPAPAYAPQTTIGSITDDRVPMSVRLFNLHMPNAGTITSCALALSAPDGSTISVSGSICGATGPGGALWRNGTTAPSNSLGVDGDLYLNKTTGDLSQRVSGAYVFVMNLLGPAGSGGGATIPSVATTAALCGAGSSNNAAACTGTLSLPSGTTLPGYPNNAALTSALAPYAALASPTFTGTPVVPGYAPLASPTFTGSPVVPGYATLASPVFTGSPVVPGYATLASPTFTGSPVVPGYLTTATAGTTYAPLASPTFTGSPTVPGYVTTGTLSSYATLASPTFTGSPVVPGYATTGSLSAYAAITSPALAGSPSAPTPALNTNTTQIATTSFVHNYARGIRVTCLGDSRCANSRTYAQTGVVGAAQAEVVAEYMAADPINFANAFLGDRLNTDMRLGYQVAGINQEVSYKLVSGGTGYTSAPTVAASPACTAASGGTGGTLITNGVNSVPGAASISGGAVTGVALGTPGTCQVPSGYLVLTGGGGSGAVVQVIAGQGGSFGKSGETSTDIDNRVGDVVAMHPDVVLLWDGTNDPSNGVTAAQTKANWTHTVQTLLADGEIVIAMTDLPRTRLGTLSVNSTNVLLMSDIDNFKRDFAINQLNRSGTNSNFILIDQSTLITDSTSATGEPIPGLLRDGLHFGGGAAAAVGYQIAQALGQKFGLPVGSAIANISTNPSDIYDATNNPYGWLGTTINEPFMLTGGGSVGTTVCTGTVAQGFTLSKTVTAPTTNNNVDTCTAALTSRTDGPKGTQQTITFSTVGGTGTSGALQTSHTVIQIGATTCPVGLASGITIHGGTLPAPASPTPNGGAIISSATGNPCLVTVPSGSQTTAFDASGTTYTWGPQLDYVGTKNGSSIANWNVVASTVTSSAVQPANNQIVVSALPSGMTTVLAPGMGIYGGTLGTFANAVPPAIIQSVSGSGPYTITLDSNTSSLDASGTVYTYGDRVKCKAQIILTNMVNFNYLNMNLYEYNGSNNLAFSAWGFSNGDRWADSSDTLRSVSGKMLTLATYPIMMVPGSTSVNLGFAFGVDGSQAASSYTANIMNAMCKRAGPLETR